MNQTREFLAVSEAPSHVLEAEVSSVVVAMVGKWKVTVRADKIRKAYSTRLRFAETRT